MLDAARTGGSRKSLPLPVGRPLDGQEARGLLAAVLAALLQGAMDPNTARAAAYILQVERRIAEGAELEHRIAALEALLAQLHLEDEVKRVEEERKQTEQRLKRLGQVYLDGLLPQEDYKRQKRQMEDRLQSLVVPGINAAQEAGKLLESLSALWAEADLSERRRILLTMLEAVYVDPVEERSVVGFRPKPAFQALFQMSATKEGSGVALINQTDCSDNESVPAQGRDCGETAMYSWWRRGRVELPVQKAP